MKKQTALPLDRDYCPLLKAASILGDRWALMLIRESFFGYRRFDDFKENLHISKSVLSNKLKLLVEHDIFAKIPYQTDKQRERFEYQLTPKGQDLYKVLIGLIEWGNEHLVPTGQKTVAILSAHNKMPLQTRLQDDTGQLHELADIRLAIYQKGEKEKD